MLPRSARLTSPNDFARATKSGFRSTSSALVGYLCLTKEQSPARCGLIISKNVGGSVVRHKVARQIRHAIGGQLSSFPEGSLLVVRALPSSIGADISGEVARVFAQLKLKAMAAL